MNTSVPYQRLAKFQVDSGKPEVGFIARLARENGWSQSHAERVYHEYLRFVYLATNSPTPLTPSDAIDQCWHLHLCYSRSYWQDLCGTVLQRPLHHGPTRGGQTEQAKYRDAYRDTLAAYRETFGQAPPADIWPPVQQRFDSAAAFRRVNSATHLVVPKRTLAAGGTALVLAAGAARAAEGSFGETLELIAKVVVGVVCVYYLLKWFSGGRGGRGGGGCSAGGCGGCGGG